MIHGVTLFGREYPYFPTIGCCFAYESANIVHIGQWLNEISKEKALPLEHRLDTICVLKQGLVANWTADSQLSLTPGPNSKIVIIPTDKSLLLFYLLLMTKLNQTWMPPLNLIEYAKHVQFGPAIFCQES